MVDELLPAFVGRRGRHRSPGASRRGVMAVAAAVKTLRALGPTARFLDEPFEVLLAAAALISGVPAALGTSRPVSLAAQLPPWMVRAWGIWLCIGGAATVIARWRIARSRTDEGLVASSRMEVAAMMSLATALGTYGLAILAAGRVAVPAAALTLAWAAAFAVRARNITRKLKEFAALRSGPDG